MKENFYLDVVNSIWGGTIYGLNFDLLMHNITINVVVPSEKISSFYELRFINVFKMNFDKNGASPGWSYVELLEIHVRKNTSPFVVEMFLWDDEQRLVIECEKFDIKLVLEN